MDIDTKNMPHYLSESLLISWYNNVCEFLFKLTDDFKDYNWDFNNSDDASMLLSLEITFSNKKERDIYGTISLEKAKEKIIKIFSQEEVKKCLKEYLVNIETREQLLKNVEQLACIPKKIVSMEYDVHNVYTHIKEIASSVKLYCSRLGEYRNATREIVLYTKNIESSCKNSSEYLKVFEKTFAHELFHFLHYYLLYVAEKDEDILNRIDATSKVIKESLASYFEYSYCNSHGIPFDKNEMWDKYEPSFFPYAGAKFIWNDAQFNEIFELSSDLDAALRKLLFKDLEGHKQFYKIKNKGVIHMLITSNNPYELDYEKIGKGVNKIKILL